MAEWGFDFARLPLSCEIWSAPSAWSVIDERALAPVDQAIAWGCEYGIHINLNLHRVPGYCVNDCGPEPFRLFGGPPDSSRRALDAFIHHWVFLAWRYRAIPSERLSFDLLNEPPFMTDHSEYIAVVRAVVEAIRAVRPDRLIFVDGVDLGQTPVLQIADLGVVQSTRGYLPKMVSHYRASWVPESEFEARERPSWPMRDSRGRMWTRDTLHDELIVKWQPVVQQGVPIHVGEWGCYVETPHDVALSWMRDLLSLWKQAGWGWAMWNLRGEFGILDSRRSDVRYERFREHQLDRAMLELLRAH